MAKSQKTEAGTALSDPVKRFYHLFRGNQRTSGRYDPGRDRSWTEDQPLKLADIAAHLSGAASVGCIPIQDDDTCEWGAIDIDDHDSDEDMPIFHVWEKVNTLRLPLILCRSKSGSIHAYAFFDRPQPANRVKTLLTQWASAIGFGGSEIFPKQGRLGTSKGATKGNWINLPYQNADKTGRYAVHHGKMLKLPEFLDLAERIKISEADLRALSMSDHPDAPPCIQKMYANGVAAGHRNEALYNVVVYLRKANPDTDITSKATDANSVIFPKPLSRSEATRTINSASRPDMQYRCQEEPLRGLCDREACLTRKYGITPADAERLNTVEAIPPFTDLVKYMTEPVRWELHIDGVKVTNISTESLMEWRFMRVLIAERLTRVVPQVKNQEWERILAPLMKEARVIEAPDDASVSGVIRDRLREFASKTDLANRGENIDDRKALNRGLPVVVKTAVGGVPDRYVAFRGQDFINYLKRTKSEELKGVNLWFAVKGLGVVPHKLRTGPGDAPNINVWVIPVRSLLEHLTPIPEQKFESEL